MTMKKHYIFLTLLLGLLNTQTISAIQSSPQFKDSLLQVIPKLKDTVKLEAMRQLTYQAGDDIVAAVEYTDNLLDEARKQKSLFYQSFALAKKVELYYSQFNSDSIFIFAQQFEAFCEERQFFEHYFVVENIVIKRYCDQQQFTLALNKAQKVYEKARETGNWLAISQSLMNLGIAYSEVGNYDEAIRVVAEAAQILRQQMNKGEKDVAIRLMEAYLNLVMYCENKKDYETMSLYSDTLQVYIHQAQIERPNNDLLLYQYYAEIFEVIANSKLNKIDEAQKHLHKANQMLSPTWGDNIKLLLWQVNSIYYEKTSEYAKALAYSDSALKFTTDYKLSFSIKANLLQKAILLGKMEKHQQSAQTYARFIAISDSLNNARYASQISELKTIYELDKAERETAQTKHRLQISRYFLAGAIAISALLALIILIIWRNRNQLKAKNLSLYRQIKEQDKLQAERELQKQQTVSSQDPSYELIERLEGLMKNDKLYTNPEVSRKMLAEKLSTNETYLFEAIRDHLGLSVSEYITQLRLNYARELLSMPENNLTIEAVAIDSGFGSRNTFHRLFRERFGLTPVEFKRLASEG